ncbi:MAG: hypothetical protein ACRC9V_10250, partial [Aeromonas sp.]
EVLDESTVEVCKPKEALELGFGMGLVHGDSPVREVVPKGMYPGLVKTAFFCYEEELMFT